MSRMPDARSPRGRAFWRCKATLLPCAIDDADQGGETRYGTQDGSTDVIKEPETKTEEKGPTQPGPGVGGHPARTKAAVPRHRWLCQRVRLRCDASSIFFRLHVVIRLVSRTLPIGLGLAIPAVTGLYTWLFSVPERGTCGCWILVLRLSCLWLLFSHGT